MHAMPAYAAPLDIAGIKWLSDYPGNSAMGLPTINSLIVLNSGATGQPYAIMDGNWITGLRTAAMTAVSLRPCLADPLGSMTIVGTGLQARTHLVMIPAEFPELRAVRVVGRTQASAEAFIASLSENLSMRGVLDRVELIPTGDREAAVRAETAIVTVTNLPTTELIDPAWIVPGTTLAIVDNIGKETALLATPIRLIVEDRTPFESPAIAIRFNGPIPAIDAVVGKVLLGEEPGRTSPDEVVVLGSIGNASLDLIFANEVFQRAVKAKRGTMLLV